MIRRDFSFSNGEDVEMTAPFSEPHFNQSAIPERLHRGSHDVGQGYRLQKLEVLNWGTFDRQVFTVRPDGVSTLLVGHNGCGKSTLVDALLTLLVRPGVRNFNVASGANKRERTERTYFEGVFNRNSDETRQEIRQESLRPKRKHTSVILASFRDASFGKVFTLAQVSYWNGQKVDPVYCFCERECSIVGDLEGLKSTDRLVRDLKERGFQATKSFTEYERWFSKLTQMKSKAMEVFNQTVAVKDIQRLNDFVRHHMLEQRNWSDRVNGLLEHFTQLNEAHQSLVRVRRQLELLNPVAEAGKSFQAKLAELTRAQKWTAAIDPFFAHKTIEIFTPELEKRRRRLDEIQEARKRWAEEIDKAHQLCGKIRGEIDNAGGPRLTQIPLEIAAEQLQIAATREKRQVYQRALCQCQIDEIVEQEEAFVAVRGRLPVLREELSSNLEEHQVQRDELAVQRGTVRDGLATHREELEGLSRRRNSLPEWCITLRENLCQSLGLSIKELPFAGELIAVSLEEQDWEASIEKVLHGFALSLLVPERHYSLVNRYVEQNRLVTHGKGQRLVYLHVGDRFSLKSESPLHSQSLIRKLSFRPGHQLVPWVKAEIARFHDYRCCETIEEFQQCRSDAMTRNRHIKSGQKRHEKDDRDRVVDPRNFVLGWDNQEKRKRIAQEIERLSAIDSQLTEKIDGLARKSNLLQEQLRSLRELESFSTYMEIDFERHERAIVALERERQAIEKKSKTIQGLKAHLAEVERDRKDLSNRLQAIIEEAGKLKPEISQAEKLLSNAAKLLQELQLQDTLSAHQEYFADLEIHLKTAPNEIEAFLEAKEQLRRWNEAIVKQLNGQFEPLQKQLRSTMSKFLLAFPEETDLVSDCEYLESFLGVREQIVQEGLPDHERRFKERLNVKVTQDIGFFRGELETEKREIVAKIDVLNLSLQRLDYRPGTFIQLEPRLVRDPEIVDFQRKLKECIEGSFEDSAEANEARFLKIRDLILKLQDENNRRWREKVTDVRRWFDFVANVIDQNSREIVSSYDDSAGQSAGEKAKLAFTILVAAIAYQYDLDPEAPQSGRFQFVVVDEMFSKVDDQNSEYALELFKQFGLQLLIVAPFDAKARITQPYVGCYVHVNKQNNRSEVLQMSAQEFEELVDQAQ